MVSLSGFDLERTEIDLFKTNSAMKNISQLTHEIDSMNKRFTNRINDNFREYSTSLLYTGRNFNDNNYERQGEETVTQAGIRH